MDKVFVVVSNFSDSNTHESSSRICFATCSKASAEKVVSSFKSAVGCRYEVVETDLYD